MLAKIFLQKGQQIVPKGGIDKVCDKVVFTKKLFSS